MCTKNGPGISIGKIQNCHIMVKKWKKMEILTKNEKEKKKKMRSGQPAISANQNFFVNVTENKSK